MNDEWESSNTVWNTFIESHSQAFDKYCIEIVKLNPNRTLNEAKERALRNIADFHGCSLKMRRDQPE